MGYTTRNNGHITDYWPDDDENTIYLQADSSRSISNLLEIAQEKWGNYIDWEDITIRSEFIHTSCIYYDLMDWGDYTNFIVLERITK